MVKQCHKQPIWEWLLERIYGDLVDGLVLFNEMMIVTQEGVVKLSP